VRSMNTRAPCGVESIRNPPANDTLFASVAELAFALGGSEYSLERGEAVAGAGETGSGAGTNGSARGCSDVVNHQTRITHTSAPKAEPDANVHSPRRSFEVEAP